MKDIKGFMQGVIMGIIASLIVLTCLIYILNMQKMLIVSIPPLPWIQTVLHWAFNNLRLSLIPFCLVFIMYIKDLRTLKIMLKNKDIGLVKISQKEHFIDVWINIFFGIGVIWTAIGMRSALLNGLGGLNASSAAENGAFFILERLINGGIILALSTTIFGGVGGYLMRLGKSLAVDHDLRQFYTQLVAPESEIVIHTLKKIEHHLQVFETSQCGTKEVLS